MQRLEIIPLSSIEPDEKNPRRNFGDIEALADTFADNGGEPYNAIVVVRDGSIYRIVDGERRYRAMRHLKTEQCHAHVCDDMDDANSMLAMLATDDKLTLTQEERSQGVQQSLLLGVDPVKVERVAKLKKGQGGKLSRAMLKVGNAGKDHGTMSLDHLLAIDEFRDDAEAVDQLMSCDAGSWQNHARRLRQDRANRAAYDAFVSACDALGVEVVAKETRGAILCVNLYSCERHLDDMADYVKQELDRSDAEFAVAEDPRTSRCYSFSPSLYKKPVRKQLTDEEAEVIASENAVKKADSRDKRRRAEFVARKLQEGGIADLPALAKLVDGWLQHEYHAADFRKLAGAGDMRFEASAYAVAVAWTSLDGMKKDALLDIVVGGKRRTGHAGYLGGLAGGYADLLDALESDGYELSDDEEVCRTEARKAQRNAEKAASETDTEEQE